MVPWPALGFVKLCKIGLGYLKVQDKKNKNSDRRELSVFIQLCTGDPGASVKSAQLNCTLRAGFHEGPGPGPSLSAFSKWGVQLGVQALQVSPPQNADLEGLDPQPNPHFENADKEGFRAWTSMETCPLGLFRLGQSS